MSRSIFNPEKVDFTKQPMFFGEGLNSQRYDVFKYPIFDKLRETQDSFFWRPQEISLQKDRADWQKIEGQHHIFLSNLKYQILLDSVQGRGPVLALLPHASLPELEACIMAWAYFETIHSKSYTHIIKNVMPNPSQVFDSILDDKYIMARAKTVTSAYDSFIEVMSTGTSLEHRKRALYKTLMSIAILEGLRFYVSFACTFAFGELRMMEGSAKIVKSIARDEAQHFAITSSIINNYREKEHDDQMLRIMEDMEEEVCEMWRQGGEEEKDWGGYVFSKGSMIGLNETIMAQKIEYTANKRVKALKLPQIYPDAPRHNPVPWDEHWLSSKNVQNAPQETEIESYLVGSIKQDDRETSFDDFVL